MYLLKSKLFPKIGITPKIKQQMRNESNRLLSLYGTRTRATRHLLMGLKTQPLRHRSYFMRIWFVLVYVSLLSELAVRYPPWINDEIDAINNAYNDDRQCLHKTEGSTLTSS